MFVGSAMNTNPACFRHILSRNEIGVQDFAVFSYDGAHFVIRNKDEIGGNVFRWPRN
jgi:hypothetical protein